MILRTLLAALVSLILLCAGIGVVVLVYMWLLWYVSLREARAPPPGEGLSLKHVTQQGLSKAEIQRLPTVECGTTEGAEGVAAAVCAVCLEPFQSGQLCRLIPICRHTFHVKCADGWLSKSSVCPMCRSSVNACDNNNNLENTAADQQKMAAHKVSRPPDDTAIAIN